jgi:hypothetical protein
MKALEVTQSGRAFRRAEVAVWVEERTNDALYLQRATNLSLGGIWLEGTLPHPPGTKVSLDIELPGDGPLRVDGEVVMRQDRGVGMAVRFLPLPQARRERLEAFLSAHV